MIINLHDGWVPDRMGLQPVGEIDNSLTGNRLGIRTDLETTDHRHGPSRMATPRVKRTMHKGSGETARFLVNLMSDPAKLIDRKTQVEIVDFPANANHLQLKW